MKREINRVIMSEYGNNAESEQVRMVHEMEDAVNQLIPNANFKYPADYLDFEELLGFIGWKFPKGKHFIQDSLKFLKGEFGIDNLLPFGIDEEEGNELPREYACLLIDGITNSKVVTIHPSEGMENVCQKEYQDIPKWFKAEVDNQRYRQMMELHGKAKCLGMGLVKDAFGPVVAIPRQLLDGQQLIMTTDAGLYVDKITNTVDKCGIGLQVLSLQKMENGSIEVTMEALKDDVQKPICIGGKEHTSPEDAYILATPFAGEFYIRLEAEDPDGNRIQLWADDFIYK